MPLRLIQPAASVAEVVRSQLAGMAQQQQFRTRALASARPSGLGLAAPHPVFNLGLDEIGKPGALDRAAMTGWRYLVTSGAAVIAAAEASAHSAKGRAVFAGTNEGAFVQASAEAIADAEQWPEIRAGRYALGLIRVPALYVVALWLRDEDGKDGGDRFVPLAPAPSPLASGKRIGGAEFERALIEIKRQRGVSEGASS
jgi:hypothetical protein